MYLQIPTLPIPKFSFTPTIFSPSVQCTNFLSTSRTSSGFCSSSKRVSKSVIRLRKEGGLVGFMCRCEGGEIEEEIDEYVDEYYMRKGLELAKKALGHTSPNPMVGCVIVKDEKIVGEGFHPKAGEPHAEVFALRDAGELAENATAYVTLEPCNHYGRTPPCTEALIKAKVKRVVVGMVDPNPIVASTGVERLQEAGIEVTVGVEKQMCKKLNEAYIHQMLTGNPFVTLRYSTSVEGYISDELEKGAKESGGYYSQLLQENDAVIFSSTLLQKHSFLLSKEPGANQPLQIVIANAPTSPIELPAIPSEIASKVIIFTDTETDVKPETAQEGIETVVLDKLSLTAILDYCKGRGISSVLVDIRGNLNDFKEILNEGFKKNLLQKFVVEQLTVMGGNKEEEFTTRLRKLIRRLQLKNPNSRNPGGSVLLEGYLRK